MNFQQILAIPFYFNIINTAFTELQITKFGLSISKIQLVDDTYYLKKIDQTLVPIDYNIRSTYGRDEDGILSDLIKFLVTAKVFEDTEHNPLGMYMLYKVKFPNGHDKSGYRQMGIMGEDNSRVTISEYSSYFDTTFYQTLVILNKKNITNILSH